MKVRVPNARERLFQRPAAAIAQNIHAFTALSCYSHELGLSWKKFIQCIIVAAPDKTVVCQNPIYWLQKLQCWMR